MFDIIFQSAQLNWETAINASAKKCVLDPEVLEYRLSSFPLVLLDLLAVVDTNTTSDMK
ncbi:MAG: hypothetical protein SV375_19115 [Thermodesulfobacteriota bacterium]|nr:hypothetical protein [Thermodesulfobacteriota bacterium]